MHPPGETRAWNVAGLRTRYSPRSRVGQGLLSVAPWVDIVLLAVFYLLLQGRTVLQPGVVVELPRGPFREGVRGDVIAVVLSMRGAAPGEREEIVFFDDERFRIRYPDQRRQLEAALAATARGRAGLVLVLEADRRVAHGTVVELIQLALEAGMARVNVATRSP
jgi:biopolymer transport protein ExbD